MPCPHCGRTTGAPTPACPHCPDANLPARRDGTSQGGMQQDGNAQAVEPEILGPQDEPHRGGAHESVTFRHIRTDEGDFQSGGAGGFRYFSWQSAPGGPRLGNDSCLPGCITLIMLLTCITQFGVLAGVAFFFFYLVGSGIAAFISIQRFMLGAPLNPWVPRVVVWTACLLLTALLAS